MKRQVLWLVCGAFVAALLNPMFAVLCRAAEPEKMLSHDVYFSLTDNSPDAKGKLIEENKANWKKVRVFDSYVAASSHEGVATEGDRPSQRNRFPLPDAAAGFAGMVQGMVVQKVEGGFALKVTKIIKEWEHNRAKDSKSLVGITVMITLAKAQADVTRFAKMLKPGEEVTIDVADKGGRTLTFLELTEDQRERVKAATTEK